MSPARPGRAVLAAGVAALLAGCGGDSGDPGDAVAVPVVRASLELTVPAEGELEAFKASPIAVPRVPTGALQVKDLVPEGSIVAPGDVLVVFDDSQLVIDRDNHKASFLSASRRITSTELESDIEEGKLEAVREISSIERDSAEKFLITDEEVYSLKEILESRLREREAAATVVYADAAVQLKDEFYDIEERILDVERGQAADKLRRVQTSLANVVLRAPIGGLVVYRKNWRGGTIGIGDTIWPGNVVMMIVDPGTTGMLGFVHERDAAGIAVGAPARVTVDALPGREFEGTVERIAEVSRPIRADSPAKFSEVRIRLAVDDAATLKPGMKARARIVVGRLDDTLVVPRAAIRGDSERPWVLVATADGTTERRDVRLGGQDAVKAGVLEGLEEGERVLLGDATETATGDAPPDDGRTRRPRRAARSAR
ncbi:MAG: efflux RND transporter periplasmic adaptor subunit [Acidobacteriota bacterium]